MWGPATTSRTTSHPTEEPTEPVADAPVTFADVGGEVTPERVCARVAELKAGRCAAVDGYALSADECRADMQRALAERGPDARRARTAQARCLFDHGDCDEIAGCLTALNPAADQVDGTPTRLRACRDRGVYAPVGLPRARWEKRRGAGVERFADVTTSKARPIEACGKPAQLDWLVNATCTDGSHPFPERSHAAAARLRNVGAGGRCGSIVDLFEVPCPERTYKIFIDAYVCPQD